MMASQKDKAPCLVRNRQDIHKGGSVSVAVLPVLDM